MNEMQDRELKNTIDQYASQCVKCALCLPHCPTYELTLDENESPRGRIALFQALAQEKLTLTEKVKRHLDQCLGCRACERVCPAHVEYGQLLIKGRALMETLPTQEPLTKVSLSTHFLSWILLKPKLRRALHWCLWLLEISKIRKLAGRLGITKILKLSNLETLLPPVAKPMQMTQHYEPINEKMGAIMLFTGCITSLCDEKTLAASIYVLRQLGMEVNIPSTQNCCGAIKLHAGDLSPAYQLAKQNLEAFYSSSKVPILTTATGCSAVLQEYNQDFSLQSNSTDTNLSDFASRITDIVSFILRSEWPKTLFLKTLQYKILIHTPCTRRNVLKTADDVQKLLTKIPGLQCQPFQSNHCCGSAGTYMLEHPSLAEPLVKNLLSELNNTEIDYLVTTNVGCGLHIARYLQSFNPTIKVVHPITLLAQSLGF